MFQNLKVFQMSQAMAQHAAARHAVVAQNIANADSPGYAAQDIEKFAQTYENRPNFGQMAATRAGHLTQNGAALARFDSSPSNSSRTQSLNGNSVSLETEMVKSIEAQRQHNRAITIYKSALTLMRSSLGR